jgi:hypothetical protein
MPGACSRPKDGVASLAYGIHVLAAVAARNNVDGRTSLDEPGHDEHEAMSLERTTR